MGDIKKIRKKYAKPIHPWNKERIEEERSYIRRYGLTNKKEVWKAETLLKNIKDQIKKFPSMPDAQAEVLRVALKNRLLKYGLVREDTPLQEVLGYTSEVILQKRLQSVVLKKGFARTPKQARQLITHEHIIVNDVVMNAPSYLVTVTDKVGFHPSSPFAQEDHPERKQPELTEKQKQEKARRAKQSSEPEIELVEISEDDAE